MLIPGLFGARGESLPAPESTRLTLLPLTRLLARAAALQVDDPVFEAALFRLFGIGRDGADELPVAPLTLWYDAGAPAGGYCLRADPVHVHAGHDTLIMRGTGGLHITRTEAAALGDEINAHLADSALRLIIPACERWYLTLTQPPAVRFSPLPAVLGQDIRPHMPQGAAARDWRGLMNEIQMVLHASEVNRRRRARGELEINSVWFWGGGELPQQPCAAFSQVWSRHPLAGGLALRGGVAPLPPPANAVEWLSAARGPTHLVVLEDLLLSVTVGDAPGWRAGMDVLLRDWIAPLRQMLHDGAIADLVICAASRVDYHINPKLMRRWWRRARGLSHYR